MTLLILGGLFLLGLLADLAGRHTPLPRVTLLLMSGVLIGPTGFDLVPQPFINGWFPTLTQIALAMIGFLMGQKLSGPALAARGRLVLTVALGKVVGSALAVAGGLWLAGVELPLALVLAGVATATDPVATFDVVREQRASGPFADTLLSVVAVDDAFGLIVFSLLLAVAVAMAGDVSPGAIALDGVLEAGVSLLFGALLGVPMAYLTGRLDIGQRAGEPIQAESFGFVLVCAGSAAMLGLSPILAAMAMGAVVSTLATHHTRSFDAIEGVEWPFMILFFVLAGTSLRFDGFNHMAAIAAGYVVARTLGTWAGTVAAAQLAGAAPGFGRRLGPALLPQAGVALGAALIASQRLPALGDTILTVVLSSTVFLELTSPLITRRMLRAAGACPSEQA